MSRVQAGAQPPAVPRSVCWAVVVGLIGDDHEMTRLMDIRAAELTAVHLGPEE
jgi:hypothetical protein